MTELPRTHALAVPRWRTMAWSGALVLAVFIAYLPALEAGFIWDDDAHVTSLALRSWTGLSRIWSDPGATQQYYPVLHSAFWLEHRAWGGHAVGYHVTNITLHAVAALLFAALLRRLAVPGAWFAAFVFALHPVHVESVAWISEQKNTLSAVFALGAVIAYLRFDENRSWRAYVFATVLFVLGLLTKSVIATVPAALLVLLWWRRGRINARRDVLPLIPWMAVGAAAGLFTAWVEQTLIGAKGAAYDLSAGQRLVLCGRAMWFYAGKLLFPADLTFIYPRWTLDPSSALAWVPLGAALLAIVWCWRVRRQSPGALAAVLLFAGMLFPALGFLNVYPFIYSFVADHFQYLASLAMIAAIAAALVRVRVGTPALRAAFGASVIVLLGGMTFAQARLYRTHETLLRATITGNPSCWMAFNNLGKELMADAARRTEAIGYFEQALALRPDYPEAENNLGLTLTQIGRPRDAIPHLHRARELDPHSFRVANNLAIALASSGQVDEGLAVFAQAAALNPQLPNIQENWGKALLLAGKKEEAARHFARAAELSKQVVEPTY